MNLLFGLLKCPDDEAKSQESEARTCLASGLCASAPLWQRVATVKNGKAKQGNASVFDPPSPGGQPSTLNLQLVRGRPRGPFKIKNLLQKLKSEKQPKKNLKNGQKTRDL